MTCKALQVSWRDKTVTGVCVSSTHSWKHVNQHNNKGRKHSTGTKVCIPFLVFLWMYRYPSYFKIWALSSPLHFQHLITWIQRRDKWKQLCVLFTHFQKLSRYYNYLIHFPNSEESPVPTYFHGQQGYVFEIMTGVKLETEEKKMADTSLWSTNCSKPWVSESHH